MTDGEAMGRKIPAAGAISRSRDDTGGSAEYSFKILIHEQELDHIAGWVLVDSNRETGGDLCGFWTHTGSPAVQFVLGPGPKARHEVAAFFQDDVYLRESMSVVRRAHGLQQIGEWHSHHRLGLPVPSSGDVRTLKRMFDQHPIDQFLLCIASIRRTNMRAGGWGSSTDAVDLGGFLFERGRDGYRRGLWVVLPGESPIGKSVRRSREISGSVSQRRCWVVPRTTLSHSFSTPKPAPDGWYTQPAAREFLRDFDDDCRTLFGNGSFSLHDGLLCYGPENGTSAWEVRFPSAFPTGQVELISGSSFLAARRFASEVWTERERPASGIFAVSARAVADWLAENLGYEKGSFAQPVSGQPASAGDCARLSSGGLGSPAASDSMALASGEPRKRAASESSIVQEDDE